MGLPVKEQIGWWGVVLAVLLVTLWFLGNALMPFLAGATLAYFLDPLADRLERVGFGRTSATAVVMLGTVLVLVLFVLLLIPLFAQQFQALAETAPKIVRGGTEWLTQRFPALQDENSGLRKAISMVENNMRDGAVALAKTALSSSLAVFDFLVLMVVAPVVAFYLLLDWDRMIASIDEWLPREHAPVIRRLAGEIDGVMGGFLRGQLSVCLILGSFYAVALELAGLQFGIVVGFIGGLLSFIPFVGATLGAVLSIGLGAFQFTDNPGWLAVIAAIFVIGQVAEGYVLTPKLVGSSVGLHPVWLMASLAVFGALFGFVGLLVAVPAAASVGVLARFGLRQYLDSQLYRGPQPPSGAP